eukprot:CAMPEP_0206301298 /NCGR_PEP_ID=MMETSP0106_2-20121207/8140_1 /ASSEMBLY_ACC=CAM_ASM_000206 /TAXON_ID=81532 /ORGANISM="Acanthoeca-like sp., Strain 10tr" /LENGTH=1176 /DNA_ID=CAMNT_0053732039 /DNA_START=168 /DNA_END=3699 /DNA_ORIENTATION=+
MQPAHKAPNEALWKALTVPVLCETWSENTLSWCTPKRASRYVCVDSMGLSLIAQECIDGPPLVVPLARCTDVRIRPFDDETSHGGPLDLTKTSPFVSPGEVSAFVSVAFYKDDDPNFKDVELFSMVFPGAPDTPVSKTREQWTAGLQHLVAWSQPWSPRYVGLEERIARVFSYVKAHETDGLIPMAPLQEQIQGHQLDRLLSTLTVADGGVKKDKKFLDATLFTFDGFRKTVLTQLISDGVKCCFDELAGKDGTLGVDSVQKFLSTVQRDPRANEVLEPIPTKSSAEAFIKHFSAGAPAIANEKPALQMNLDDFTAFLLSTDNDYMSAEHREVVEDMNFPLAAYFVASSHNTFLVAGQVFSTPKVEIYRQVLLSGCRCIEIDIWNGKSVEGADCPIVTHGPSEYTKCKSILFRDVMLAIKDAAFVNSEYPVILSFENHCNLLNQQAMATDVKTIFGGLLCQSYMDGDGGTGKSLPSPSQLRCKIIIKNKRLRHLVKQALPRGKNDDNSKIRVVVDGDVVEETDEEKQRRLSKAKVRAEELSDIVNYVWPVTFKGFDIALQTDNCYHMSSFNETKSYKYACAGPEIFSSYCQKQLARVYPKGTRLSSSNYNPMSAWMVGVQLVALNYQTTDSYPMHYNIGMFTPNGTCGYRLKPACMRGHYSESVPVHKFASLQRFTPFTDVGVEQVVQWDLGVTVMAALASATAPVISISVAGIPADDTQSRPWELTLRDRRKFVVPRWKQANNFRRERVILPDIALLRIVVSDRNNGASLGWQCIPVYDLQQGYHVVPLRSGASPLAHVILKIEYSLQSGEHSAIVDKLVNPTDYSSKEAKAAALSKMMAPDEDDIESLQETKCSVTLPARIEGAAAAPAAGPAAEVELPAIPPPTVLLGRGLMAPFVTDLEALAGHIKAEADHPENVDNMYVRSVKPAELLTKYIAKTTEKYQVARRKLTVEYYKEEATVVANFTKEVKRLFQRRSTLTTKDLNHKLVGAELLMKRQMYSACMETFEVLHRLVLEQELQLSKSRLKRLSEVQGALMKVISQKFEDVANHAIHAGEALFKRDPSCPPNKRDFQAAWNRVEETFLERSLTPLLDHALGTAKNVHNEQLRRMEVESAQSIKQLRTVQEKDALVIQKQFESEENRLQRLQADQGPYWWENLSLCAYINALEAKGRCPK